MAKKTPEHASMEFIQKHKGAYGSYSAMMMRCYRKGNTNYINCGGRGIIVRERWKNKFENFYADMGDRPEGLTILRIDKDGNYEPSNCRWATRAEQNRSKRPFSKEALDNLRRGIRKGAAARNYARVHLTDEEYLKRYGHQRKKSKGK